MQALLRHHVLANLTFTLILVVGALSYQLLPRQQDPTMNFNWIVVTTLLPGASALDVEKKITDPLEEAIRKVQDIRFVSSNSRQSVSSLLIRFDDISDRVYDKRVSDLRREIQNREAELPDEAEDPMILEITSANAFPAASVAVIGMARDEALRKASVNVEKDLEQLSGVDRVDPIGISDPELLVEFDPATLEAYRINPDQIADTVQGFFQDIAAGDLGVGNQIWLVRLVGTSGEPLDLAQRTLVGVDREVPLADLARIRLGQQEADQLASLDDQPATLMAVMKQADANTIELVERVKGYIEEKNQTLRPLGIHLQLADDQTQMTRSAINLMQNNALIGLLLVLLVAWLFLGSRIALLTAIGIPFVLAGTFWVLWGIGESLNVMVLLGIVIVLGMLVDDAVVVVEGIYHRLRLGQDAVKASLDTLREVALPVTSAVATTMAAFGPLLLLPGILGDFMRVVPLVVVTALAISLLEAFWMLPAHIIAARINFERPSRVQRYRERLTHALQIGYVRLLVKGFRHRVWALLLALSLFVAATTSLVLGMVRMDFFAADTVRLFYVSIEMPAATPIQATLDKAREVERLVRGLLLPGEARAVISYAGNMFTETEPRLGDHYGQVMVGLKPQHEGMRSVEEIIEAMRAPVNAISGPTQLSFLKLSGGPPSAKPISVKVRGDEYQEIRAAADTLKGILASIPGVKDIGDDASRGRMELVLEPNQAALSRVGMSPAQLYRNLQLLVDGQMVAETRKDGEKLVVRVRSGTPRLAEVDNLLATRLVAPDGSMIALSELFRERRQTSLANIRHYNFRRAITVEADLDETVVDTVSANRELMRLWQRQHLKFPNIDLDVTGELDDIKESMDAIGVLFVFGVGLMYLILGAQFRSYWQPLMILVTVPMAFTGVVLGLLVSRNPMSLYTLYGVVALAGISVNAAIVLISAANSRLQAGMSLLHATIYAARRRVVPILITSLTTIAGLFSLATGLGGKSLIWGPVATAIVWGLAFSTILTLIAIPLLYQAFMPNRGRRDGPISTADGEKTVAANDSNPLHGQEKTV